MKLPPSPRLSSSGDERTRWGSALAVEGLDGLVDGDVEGVGVTERAVGEVVALQVAPGPLDVVQLGRVLRQPLGREPGPRRQRLPARLARVDPARVEHQDHRRLTRPGAGPQTRSSRPSRATKSPERSVPLVRTISSRLAWSSTPGSA